MNRRHFIKTSGASLGGLLITPMLGTFCSCVSPQKQKVVADIIALPDEVIAHTGNGIVPLGTTNRQTWTKNQITVDLRITEDCLSVVVHSPVDSLRSIVLTWKHASQPSYVYLGDAWERAYGDLRWLKVDNNRIMPWYMMEFDAERTHGFGVKTGCRAFCYWQLRNDTLQLTLDVRCGGKGVNLGQRELHAADIVTRKGKMDETAYQATRAFCRQMCTKPRLPRDPMVGTIDWYYTYGKCTDKLFLEEAALFANLVDGCGVKGFALVDAGWAPGDRSAWHSDQTTTHPDFGSIQKVGEGVAAMGLAPGIWTRVLCTNPKDPDSVRLSRDKKYLDPSLPQNLERIRELMKLFRSWGFTVIKHDYTTYDIFGRWGPEMGAALTKDGWAFADSNRTTAEIILALYQAIRDGCGDGGYIIGCNTISHLSAGLFEFCRIGDDSGNNLERAMKYGCNPFAFRLSQHNTFYTADPDCIGNLKEIPWKYNRQFIQLVAASGALLQTSTRLGSINEEQRKTLRDACQKIGSKQPKNIEPLDWMERGIPARWKINDQIVVMDWDLTKP